MINWQRVRELREDLGSDDFEEVIEVFLEEVEERLDVLGQGSPQKVSEDMHFLKGSAANLGFSRLQSLCQSGEVDPNAVTSDEIRICYAASKTEFLNQHGPAG